MPSHYLNQCRFIVSWTLRNIFELNLNQNIQHFSYKKLYLKYNSCLESVEYSGSNLILNILFAKKATILSGLQCDKHMYLSHLLQKVLVMYDITEAILGNGSSHKRDEVQYSSHIIVAFPCNPDSKHPQISIDQMLIQHFNVIRIGGLVGSQES